MRPPTHLASDVFLRRLLMRTSTSGAVSRVSTGCFLLRRHRLVRGACGAAGGSLGRRPGLGQVGEVKKRHGRIVPHVCVHTMNGSRIGRDAWVIVSRLLSRRPGALGDGGRRRDGGLSRRIDRAGTDMSENATCTDARVASVGASARRLRESCRVGSVKRTVRRMTSPSGFCQKCGNQMGPSSQFCDKCGTPAGAVAPSPAGAVGQPPYPVAAAPVRHRQPLLTSHRATRRHRATGRRRSVRPRTGSPWRPWCSGSSGCSVSVRFWR